MPTHLAQKLNKAFSKFDQRIVWKWETELMQDKSENILLKKWVDQQDVLGHPKVKLFITHGGMLSNLEGVYHKVPMLIIPGYFDQFYLASWCVRNGVGIHINWEDVTVDILR